MGMAILITGKLKMGLDPQDNLGISPLEVIVYLIPLTQIQPTPS